MNDARVNFAGYCVPHPSEPVVHIRVQTNGEAKKRVDDGDSNEEIIGGAAAVGQLTAIDALKDACRTLGEQCDFVLGELEKAMPEVKADRERLKRLEEDMFRDKGEIDEMEE